MTKQTNYRHVTVATQYVEALLGKCKITISDDAKETLILFFTNYVDVCNNLQTNSAASVRLGDKALEDLQKEGVSPQDAAFLVVETAANVADYFLKDFHEKGTSVQSGLFSEEIRELLQERNSRLINETLDEKLIPAFSHSVHKIIEEHSADSERMRISLTQAVQNAYMDYARAYYYQQHIGDFLGNEIDRGKGFVEMLRRPCRQLKTASKEVAHEAGVELINGIHLDTIKALSQILPADEARGLANDIAHDTKQIYCACMKVSPRLLIAPESNAAKTDNRHMSR